LASAASAAASFSTEAGTPPVLTGTVTITGNAVFDQTLTANTSGLSSNPPGPLGTLTYQWKRGSANIGANAPTYTLVQADIGSTITLTVTAANCTGSVTSNPTSTVTKATQTAPAAPTLADKTPTSITLNSVTGCEYNMNSGAYQSSPIFTGLTPNTAYTFTQRYAETATHLASAASTTATFITDPPAAASISGKALRPNQTPLSMGEVSLYRVQSLSQYILMETVHIGNDGTYEFTNVAQGGYIVKAVAPSEENALPTYYGNSENWEQATLITVAAASVPNVDITVIAAPEIPEGDSEINGVVVEEDGGKSRSPVGEVTIYLLEFKNSVWNTIATTLSDAAGGFAFSKLAAGKYMTIVDAPGLKMLNSLPLDLAVTDTINIVFIITDEGIETRLGGVGIATQTLPEIKVYPNPTTGELRILMNNEQLTMNNVEVFDIYGRKVEAKFPSNSLEGWQPQADGVVINISHLATGIYVLKISTEAGQVVKKVLKE
jgi:hypothetical protein